MHEHCIYHKLSGGERWAIKCESHKWGGFCPHQDASNAGYWDSYQVMATEWKLLSDDYQATSGSSVSSTVATSAALPVVRGLKVVLREPSSWHEVNKPETLMPLALLLQVTLVRSVTIPINHNIFHDILWAHCLPRLLGIFHPHGGYCYNSLCLFFCSTRWKLRRCQMLHLSALWDVHTTRFLGNSLNGFVI